MSEHVDDQFDAAIDRAARQLVEHDPPPRLYAAVNSEVRVTTAVTRGSRLRWSLVAVSAAAAFVLALTLGGPRQDVPPDPPAPRLAVGPEAAPARTEPPMIAPPMTERVPGEPRRSRRAGPPAPPVVSELAAAVTPIAVREIPLESVHVGAIPLEDVAIRSIHIADIDIEPR